MGSDEGHFNVSLIARVKVTNKTVSRDHNLFEEKGEPKRFRTEVILLTSLTPYRWAKPAYEGSATSLLLISPGLCEGMVSGALRIQAQVACKTPLLAVRYSLFLQKQTQDISLLLLFQLIS